MAPTSFSEPAGFSILSKSDQIRYLQELWDRIAEKPGEIPVPESQIRLAEDRLAAYRREPGQVRPAYEVIDRLGKKNR